jgi:hypothetical protein
MLIRSLAKGLMLSKNAAFLINPSEPRGVERPLMDLLGLFPSLAEV